MFSAVLILLLVNILATAALPFLPYIICIPIIIPTALATMAIIIVHRARFQADKSLSETVEGVTLDHNRQNAVPEEAPQKTVSTNYEVRINELEGENLRLESMFQTQRGILEEIRDLSVGVFPKESNDAGAALRKIAARLREESIEQRNWLSSMKRRIENWQSRLPETTYGGGLSRVFEGKELVQLSSALEELADQSNILAINGAIEAARVGVKGRGFSVIAAEMQRFSTRAVEIAGQLGVFTVAAQESKEAATALHDGFEGARREAEHLAAEVESLTTDNSAVEEVPGELTELGDSIEALSSRASYFDEVSDKLDRIAVLTEPYSTG